MYNFFGTLCIVQNFVRYENEMCSVPSPDTLCVPDDEKSFICDHYYVEIIVNQKGVKNQLCRIWVKITMKKMKWHVYEGWNASPNPAWVIFHTVYVNSHCSLDNGHRVRWMIFQHRVLSGCPYWNLPSDLPRQVYRNKWYTVYFQSVSFFWNTLYTVMTVKSFMRYMFENETCSVSKWNQTWHRDNTIGYSVTESLGWIRWISANQLIMLQAKNHSTCTDYYSKLWTLSRLSKDKLWIRNLNATDVTFWLQTKLCKKGLKNCAEIVSLLKCGKHW